MPLIQGQTLKMKDPSVPREGGSRVVGGQPLKLKSVKLQKPDTFLFSKLVLLPVFSPSTSVVSETSFSMSLLFILAIKPEF